MNRQIALIIDDEPDIRELLEITLSRMGLDCMAAENLQQAKDYLADQVFDICLTDMRLPDGDGVEFVSFIQKKYPEMPVAVISAHGTMDSAIQALKNGAFDFLTKPVDLAALRSLINSALALKKEQSGIETKTTDRELIGETKPIQDLRVTIEKVSRSQAPIYISGESGTGKELVARMIHELGPRKEKPFIPVNCGAIPHELMESEFFGHIKGSFTGADSDKLGLFQSAEGGTLFLDEVAELPLHLQVKLLRAIQEKRVRPVGSQQEVEIDIRILSATHMNLSEMVEAEKFRRDLYYRINVIEINVPALRERIEDIPSLVEHILSEIVNRSGQTISYLSNEAMQKLQAYDFPGNIRELENILERAITLAEGELINPQDLLLKETAGSAFSDKQDVSRSDDSDPQGAPLEHRLDDVEKKAILEVLEETRWNRTAAAKKLGLSLRALRYRLEKYGLNK